ncbi:hydroxysteroid dehydrogenase-like protein 1 [Penaeus japonicus]|uniref:hydroxysteroid dehydrogenase-like protein 1 n=1 Tax=Penaeus japonicus TaxID=27405 RepID=UPI001C713A7D|nr:hydroxysteroid dehydrogenase-like protein 1 [Penaeus japonicus]
MSDSEGFQFFPSLGTEMNIVTFLGLLTAAKFLARLAWDVVVGLRAHVWSKLWKKDLVKTYGEWAIVTGCTDGIGKAYTFELAKNGMNIILISRTAEKLQSVATEIDKKYGVKTEEVQVDFSLGKEIYSEIERQIEGKEIGILVNNVGVITPHPMSFGEVNDHILWSHVNVNVASPLAMTKIILPQMLQRRKGAIVNLASIAGRCPIPLLQIYSSSKAFVDYFSEALGVEYRSSGLTVQTITPSYVSTNMTSYSEKIYKPSLAVPTASNYAAHALATLGYTNYTTGYWTHGILAWILDNFASRWFLMRYFKLHNEDLLRDMNKNKRE